MPTMDQQDMVNCMGQTYDEAIAKLKETRDSYPALQTEPISADRFTVASVWPVNVMETI